MRSSWGRQAAGNPTAGYPFGGPWIDNTSNSQWIAPQEYVYVGGGGSFPGDYTYTISFNLTGLNPATAVITGEWAADDAGPLFSSMGTLRAPTYSAPAYGAFQSFTISSGFVAGVNTLAFEVQNICRSYRPPGG